MRIPALDDYVIDACATSALRDLHLVVPDDSAPTRWERTWRVIEAMRPRRFSSTVRGPIPALTASVAAYDGPRWEFRSEPHPHRVGSLVEWDYRSDDMCGVVLDAVERSDGWFFEVGAVGRDEVLAYDPRFEVPLYEVAVLIRNVFRQRHPGSFDGLRIDDGPDPFTDLVAFHLIESGWRFCAWPCDIVDWQGSLGPLTPIGHDQQRIQSR